VAHFIGLLISLSILLCIMAILEVLTLGLTDTLPANAGKPHQRSRAGAVDFRPGWLFAYGFRFGCRMTEYEHGFWISCQYSVFRVMPGKARGIWFPRGATRLGPVTNRWAPFDFEQREMDRGDRRIVVFGHLATMPDESRL
jgi:hypothetical protein